MKFICLILFFMLFASCSSSKESLNEEDTDVNDIEEVDLFDEDQDKEINDGDSPDEEVTTCHEDWEEGEVVELDDASALKIEKKEEHWDWIEEDSYDVFLYSESGANLNVRDMCVNDSEDIFIIVSDNTGVRKEFLKILRNNGVMENYFVESGFSNLPANLTYSVFCDKDAGDTYILLNLPVDSNDGIQEYFFRPFIIKIDDKGDWTISFVDFEGSNTCHDIYKMGEKFYLSCSYSKTDSNFAQSVKHPSVIIVENEKALRKIFSAKSTIFPSTISQFKGKITVSYTYAPLSLGSDASSCFYFEIDEETMCEKIINMREVVGYYEFTPLKHVSTGKERLFYGVSGKIIENEFQGVPVSVNTLFGSWVSVEHGSYKADEITLLGSYDSFFRDEEEIQSFYDSFIYLSDMKKHGHDIFFTGYSSVDMEDKGRWWYDEDYLKSSSWYFSPYIGYIDNSGEIFLKQMIIDIYSDRSQIISKGKNDIYISGNFFSKKEEGAIDVFIYRIPDKWLINENSKAKESRVWKEKLLVGVEEAGGGKVISSGGMHTCIIDEKNYPFCWGRNIEGQVGSNNVGDNRINEPSFVDIFRLGDQNVVSINSGYKNSCLISELGRVYCWGKGLGGLLGNGTQNDSFHPVPVDTSGDMNGKKIVQVSVGTTHACSLDDKGSVYCWGVNPDGQLGIGDVISQTPVPVAVDMTGLKDNKLIHITNGSSHTCGIDAEGSIYCWGANNRGQLGIGEGGVYGDKRYVPVKSDTGEENYVWLSAGSSHSCALSDKGRIFCFGDNYRGQLGDGTTEMRLTPVEVKSDKTFKSVSAGFEHTCAVAQDEVVYCWGRNIVGQLGTGDNEDSLTPAKVKFENNTNIKAVSCGHRHTCAIDDKGTVYCWGQNQDGQLGNGTYDNSNVPVEIKTPNS